MNLTVISSAIAWAIGFGLAWLNGAKRVLGPLGIYVGLVRKLWSIKRANAENFIVNSYSGIPFRRFAIAPCNTEIATQVVAGAPRSILVVFSIGRFSKVGNPVVRSISVNVIYESGWVIAKRVNPRKSVAGPFNAFDGNCMIASWVNGPDTTVQPSPSFWIAPSESTRIRVVVENFLQALCGKIGLSHAVVPCKQWVGQKPRRVISTAGLRHFSSYLFRRTA